MSIGSFLRSVGLVDLLQGLSITGKFIFHRKATIQYPEQRKEPTQRFRGMLGYDVAHCDMCLSCAKVCPIKIIFIEGHRVDVEIDGKKRKKAVIDRYDIDIKRCMFCGLCEESCPTKAIWLTTKTYETANYDRDNALYFNKERLMNWEGVKPYPGVILPGDGQDPDNPTKKRGEAN